MRKKHNLSPHNLKPGLVERFSQKVHVVGFDECWEWTGSRFPERASANGPVGHYGRVYLGGGRGGRIDYAHRVAYVLNSGECIPEGMIVMHTCDNPPCCNPRHLRLATLSENSLDRDAKGRRTYPGPNSRVNSVK